MFFMTAAVKRGQPFKSLIWMVKPGSFFFGKVAFGAIGFSFWFQMAASSRAMP